MENIALNFLGKMMEMLEFQSIITKASSLLVEDNNSTNTTMSTNDRKITLNARIIMVDKLKLLEKKVH